MKRIMSLFTVCCAVTALASYASVLADESETKPSEQKLRVGTFDSRLVAIAYARSEMFQRRVAKLHADHKEAKAAGNEKRVKQLETAGPALQELIEKQSYSTWPVDDILQTIKGKMPEIAKQANVDVVVSKWNVVFQRKGVDLVDVTDLMVKPFNPTEETRKILDSIRKKEPLPIDTLKKYK